MVFSLEMINRITPWLTNQRRLPSYYLHQQALLRLHSRFGHAVCLLPTQEEQGENDQHRGSDTPFATPKADGALPRPRPAAVTAGGNDSHVKRLR